MDIKLEFNKELTCLAGTEYGNKIYDTQLKNKISNKNEVYTIIFPEQITCMSTHFAYGLIVDCLKLFKNREEFLKHIKFKFEYKHLKDRNLEDYI